MGYIFSLSQDSHEVLHPGPFLPMIPRRLFFLICVKQPAASWRETFFPYHTGNHGRVVVAVRWGSTRTSNPSIYLCPVDRLSRAFLVHAGVHAKSLLLILHAADFQKHPETLVSVGLRKMLGASLSCCWSGLPSVAGWCMKPRFGGSAWCALP